MSRSDIDPREPEITEHKAWTSEELGELLTPLVHRRAPEDPATQNPLVQAAAVLSYFNPTTLRPTRSLPDEDRGHALQVLVDRSTVVLEEGERRWTLNDDMRRKTLREMGDTGALQRALAANLLPGDSRQRILDGLLSGETSSVEDLSLAELRQLHQVSSWLAGVSGVQFPPPAQLRARMAREELLAPFRHLVGSHFRGRRRELDALRRYAEVIRPEALAAQALSTSDAVVRMVLRLEDKPPLFVHGPGGTGKSTLLARFILEHAEAAERFRFPFVYLDFDRPGLLGEDPTTLLIEIAAQLDAQYPGAGFGKMRQGWSEVLIQVAGRAAHGEAERVFETSISDARLHRDAWIEEIRAPLDELLGRSRPFILVLDTFEEAQYRSHAYVRELWQFLGEFQKAVPRMRTLLAGRAPLEKYPVDNYPLGDFDEEAALGFLQHLDVRTDAARRLYVQLGGNPLTLKLAAEVARLEAPDGDGIQGLSGRRFWFFRVDAARVQGQLYDRILSHIHDPRVRRLAHPGLVLRRITPEVILEVLAEPCGVAVTGILDARDLFGEFSREVSLVYSEADGSLRHRSDIRRVMLPLVRDAANERIEEIHRRAVAFYERESGPAARGEELYHRLWLGEDEKVLDRRWDPAVGPSLAGTFDELPPAGQAYLGGKLGREVSAEVRSAGAQQTWEVDAERRARELVKVGRIRDALGVVRERKKRMPGSRLYVLEGTILSRLDRAREALEVVQAGLATVDAEGSQGTALDLVLLDARLHELTGKEDRAACGYEEVVRMAQGRRDARLVWEGGLARLALHHAGLAAEPLDVLACRDRLVEAYDDMAERERARYAGILRCLAGEIAHSSPARSLDIVRSVGVGPVSAVQGRAYLAYLVDAGDPSNHGIASRLDVELAGLLAGAREEPKAERLGRIQRQIKPQRLGAMLEKALNRVADATHAEPFEIRALGAALRAAGLPQETDPTPAGRQGMNSQPSVHGYFDPPDEVVRHGRRLVGESYTELVRQLDHGEVLVGLFHRPDGVRSAPLLGSEERMADFEKPHLSPAGYYAVWLARANLGLGPNRVRAVRLYPSTGVETIVPVSMSVRA
jgi:hypothetical protein